MPLIRRMPKRGFNNSRFGLRYVPVNLVDLNLFEDGAVVDEASLRSIGLANGPVKKIKILGQGELKKKLTVNAHAFSASARVKIESLGGVCSLIGAKPEAAKTEGAKAKTAKPEGKKE